MKEKYFPRTSNYSPEWIAKNSLLHNTLFYTESLCSAMSIDKNMRVMDLGCGNAISSIFLAKEFGVNVCAVDKEVSPSHNLERIREMGVVENVIPLRVDARRLPFPSRYFDIVISIDSFSYYGTDDWYIPYISQFLKPNALIGISEWCFSRELASITEVPDYLRRCYQEVGFHSMHSLEWWKNHFEKAGLFKVEVAEILPENEYLIQDYISQFQHVESEKLIVDALRNDHFKTISAFRLVARRTEKVEYLDDFEDKQEL